MKNIRIALMGAGNIGTYIANGLAESRGFSAKRITLTRRKAELLDGMKKKGFLVEADNAAAAAGADVVIVAVEPQQMDEVLAPHDRASSRVGDRSSHDATWMYDRWVESDGTRGV